MLCPGSRSGPLAIAAGELSVSHRLTLHTAIDERSAAFLALGISTSTGMASAVITTSGSAVANLLPAAIEADRSCQPILFLTADRPLRLKECGSNQTVNQEDFLSPVCRFFAQGPLEGAHLFCSDSLNLFVENAWRSAHVFPGPVHLNLPLEEPLHASLSDKEQILSGWVSNTFMHEKSERVQTKLLNTEPSKELLELDPSLPGVVIAGPWRGSSANLVAFQQALRKWQALSGWPILADPLAGVPNDQPGLIRNWELLLPEGLPIPLDGIQVLRLGPMSTSRNLEVWLRTFPQSQLLVTEGDLRRLDPLGVALQWSEGFVAWLQHRLGRMPPPIASSNQKGKALFKSWLLVDRLAEGWLDQKLPLRGSISEPALAHWLPRLLPEGLPVMLAASSPIRDWLSFGGGGGGRFRRCFGFRGASGIDGTLSLAMGLAMTLGQTLLVSGDLALLHDSNGWLLANPSRPPLVVLLIDNGGGGIFKQLKIDTVSNGKIDQLFSMPQNVDQLALADAHGIPSRQVSCLEDLESSLEWSLAQFGPVLLRVCTDSKNDSYLRNELRVELAKYIQSINQKHLSE